MTQHGGSLDSGYHSAEEVNFYWEKVRIMSAQVLAGERELADVPMEYLGDVIEHAFNEATDKLMSLDQYMRYITFSAFLRKRKEKGVSKHCAGEVSIVNVELCE